MSAEITQYYTPRHSREMSWTARRVAMTWAAAARLKGRRLLYALPIGCVLAAALVYPLVPPSYVSRASLVVRFSSDYTYRPLVGASESITPWRPDSVVNAELEILNSEEVRRAALAKVGAKRLVPDNTGRSNGVLGLLWPVTLAWRGYLSAVGSAEPPPASVNARALEVMRRNLLLKTVADSNVIHLEYRAPDAALSADMLSAMIQAYQDRRLDIYANQTLGFLTGELAARERALAETRDRLVEHRTRAGILNYEDDRRALADQLADLQNERARLLSAGDREAGPSRAPAARATQLVVLIDAVRDKIRALDVANQEADVLAADVTTELRRIEELRQRIDEAKLQAAMSQARLSSVKLLDAPRRPEIRSGLSLKETLALAAALGLFSALALVIFLNVRPRTDGAS